MYVRICCHDPTGAPSAPHRRLLRLACRGLTEQTALAAVGCKATWSEIYKELSAADAQVRCCWGFVYAFHLKLIGVTPDLSGGRFRRKKHGAFCAVMVTAVPRMRHGYRRRKLWHDSSMPGSIACLFC